MGSSHHNTSMATGPLVSRLCRVLILTNQEILGGALSTPTYMVLRDTGLWAQSSQPRGSYIREPHELRVNP